MTTGTVALLAWLRQSTNTGPLTANMMTSGPSTTRTTDAPRRQYRIHIRRMCDRCRQEGHYTRDCPQMTDQKPTEMKVGRMQTFLRAMTPTERAKFKEYILNDGEKSKAKTPIISLSRETSPHTNQIPTAVPPSRKTSPHSSQALEKLVKVLKHCKECNGEHPTRICVKQFQRLQKPEPTPYLVHDDDSMGSDTLYDSEGSEGSKARPTTDPLTHPTKSVTFSLPEDRLMTPKPESPSYDADELENDKADA